ncbi:hypothetical protein [Clavibacter michiganensis]|uniref:hypothetical protein n=1 Tax=Clavibacter michiganensis TaxID=28447 RepID=UPI0029305F6F|nr:hypothetical protein [Clavibacter michiganensis]
MLLLEAVPLVASVRAARLVHHRERALVARVLQHAEGAGVVDVVEPAVGVAVRLRVAGDRVRRDAGELLVLVEHGPVAEVDQEAHVDGVGQEREHRVRVGQQLAPVLGDDRDARVRGGQSRQTPRARREQLRRRCAPAGDDAGVVRAEGLGVGEAVGDPPLVLVGVGRVREVAVVDEERVERDPGRRE